MAARIVCLDSVACSIDYLFAFVCYYEDWEMIETSTTVVLFKNEWKRIVDTYPRIDVEAKPYVAHPYSALLNGRYVVVIETLGM